MPRTPYRHLMQAEDDDEDDEDEVYNVNKKFSLLNKNEEKKSLMNSPSNLSPDIGFAGIELRSRNMKEKSSPSRSSENSWPSNNGGDTIFVERKIRKSDSLRNLALQYGISVAELKRANGLMSDQEFYGKDILKIPVKKYGYHHDLHSNEDIGDTNETAKNFVDEFVDLNFDYVPAESTSTSKNNFTSNLPTTTVSGDRETMPPEMYLKTLDDNLLKVKTAQQELERQNRRADDDDQPIEETGVAVASPIRSSWLEKNVSHFVVVVLLIFVVIVLPLLVVLYKIFSVVEDSINGKKV